MKTLIPRIWKISLYSVLTISLSGIFTVVHAAVFRDDLWQKATTIAESNRWVPGKIVEQEEVKNQKGKIEEKTETHLQLIRQGNDTVEIKVLKSVKDGKDATKEAQKEIEETLPIANVLEELDNPFTPANKQNFSVAPLQQQKVIQGRNCLAYQYTYTTSGNILGDDDKGHSKKTAEKKELLFEGIAWIDELSGAPFEIETELKSLPLKEKNLKIHSLRQVDRYAFTEDGKWYPVESVADIQMEISMLLFKFKGNVNTISQYSEHWKL